MSNLVITKEKVLEAASKCSTAKATLKVLFPEAFEKQKWINVNRELTISPSLDDTTGPVHLAGPDFDGGKWQGALVICFGYEMRQHHLDGLTVLTFHVKEY
jgi:hypothetical protein